MVLDKIFPTLFAKNLGEASLLIPKLRRQMLVKDHEELRERLEMMQSFQSMAMACAFDDCLIAFHGIKLTDKQKDALVIIHKSTRLWIFGTNVALLMEKLHSPLCTGRDAKDLTEAIVEHLQEKIPEGKNKGNQQGHFDIHEAKD